jgi:energy-coupling factor transport system ATP-binding protein
MARLGDDVAFGPENLGVLPAEIPARVERALVAVGLGHLPRDSPTARLSTGRRQRLALAGVLAMEPDLVLLDEPTAMLDPAGALLLRDAVLDHVDRTGATLVLVEHRIDDWVEQVDRIVVMDGGGLRADGPPAQVMGRHRSDLARAGGWVPGLVPLPPRATRSGGEPLLVVRDLAAAPARGSGADRPAPVVSGVHLDLRRGAAVALTGANGSGKTTLLHVLGGLARPAAGSLTATPVLAAGAGAEPYRWRARDLARRVQTVFAEPRHQFLAATVLDEVALGPRRLRMPGAEAVAADLVERLGLAPLARANPWTLSGGEQRRLSVATALAVGPAVLALDEPTFGQDARTWAELVSLLAGLLDDGTAIVTATHDLHLVRALGAHEHRVGDGHVVPAPAGAAA